MAKEKTLFLRNWRPHRVRVKYEGLAYNLERRGDMRDTLSLPADAENDPVIAKLIKQDRLERITKDQFHRLAARVEDAPFPKLKHRATETNVEMLPEDHRTPTLVVDGSFDAMSEKGRATMSPNIETVNPPKSTEEELSEQEATE